MPFISVLWKIEVSSMKQGGKNSDAAVRGCGFSYLLPTLYGFNLSSPSLHPISCGNEGAGT
jgi:hypothetical protein